MNRNISIKTYEANNLLFSETTTCTLEDDILSYSTDSENIRINCGNFSFTKENNETILKINHEKCTLTLKELHQSLDIPLDYINYQFDNNKNILIEYKLVSQESPLKIEIEIGDINNEI
ncbi:MAG: hypothetical protein K2J20_04220 [Bacilli bacterium]|nr:hypothetical protein [Bacilli bacterium]